jgi:two-component system, OmpR family, KDP operon response regulator KdpE
MARGPRVLIVDDDPAIRTLLRRGMRAAGYRVEDAAPSQDLLSGIAERQLDLLILDIDSPVSGGADAIRRVRECSPVPLLVLSAQSDEDAIVRALSRGADDYVRKPFGTKELLARAENALRRQARERGTPAPLVIDGLEIDLLHRRVYAQGVEVHLAVKPYEVLRVLAESAGRVLTHNEILNAVWGPRRLDQVDRLRLAIRELRRKLEADPAHPRYILTETGVGYRLQVAQRAELAAPRPPARFQGRQPSSR